MAPSGQQVNLMSLPLPQLNVLKEQVEQSRKVCKHMEQLEKLLAKALVGSMDASVHQQEIEVMQNTLQQLKVAQNKFMESKACMEKVTPENEGKDVLVPLTASLYVPGQLKDVNNVLIDIGTGYYAEKTVPEAKQYFQRKVDFVTKQMERVQPVLIEKSKMRQVVTEVMSLKIQAQLSQQQPGASNSKP